jgi:5'-nucleotidase
MAKRSIDLARARLLVTNDDGIHAPGIKLLEKIARKLAKDIWVSAPETEQSAASHSLTLHQPLRIRRVRRQHYAVSGTPTDSVLLALHHIVDGKTPDLALSGVNRGANLGEDITYSGTVAAAMEATLLGVPAIALSLYVEPGKDRAHWATAEAHLPGLIKRVCAAGWPDGVLINVNLPDLPPGEVKGIRVTRQGRRKIGDNLVQRVDPRGRPYTWIGTQRDEGIPGLGTDLAAVYAGYISVTPVHLDLTHRASMRALKEVLA